ncbi:MAG: polysaccharide deacetylase family protein [Candidatus Rokuibacteriota bacterium]
MTGARLALTGAVGAWIGYVWLPHLVTPVCVWRGPRGGRQIALTFDDGPDPAWTPRILESLASRGARGTFFLVGQRAARAPDVVRAIALAGHEVANHSWSHRSLWLSGPARTEVEIGRSHLLLSELTGREPRHFRPPWGMVNAAMFVALRRWKERCVFWSIQPEGLRPRVAAGQAAHVIRRAHPGGIVDLHDAEGVAAAPTRLLEALPAMIDGLRDAGYTLVTVAELLEPADDAGARLRLVPAATRAGGGPGTGGTRHLP